MKRILLLLPLLLLTARAESPRPNVLVIVSDDQGSADAGFNGCRDIPTPHLDRLAAGGVRCTSGYVSHPFCSPTRAGLLTGRYQQRFGHENNPFYDPADAREGLPLTETLWPALFREAGYATGWIGKWHLGSTPAHKPLARGFSEGFGFIGGGHKFRDWKENPAVEYAVPIERNGRPVAETEHLTTAFGREAEAFVTRHAAKPWLLYLAFNAPHTPHEPTPAALERVAAVTDPVRRKYAAQLVLMDDAVGRVLDALKASGQEGRTLVFFFSDNGGPVMARGANGSSNAPLRDGKGSVHEGGVRVPFVVRWPDRLPAGKDFPRPVISLDVMATALAAAGLPSPTGSTLDSVNLLPWLSGERDGDPHAALFWRSGPQRTVRAGDWKLVRGPDAPDRLYDLASDPGEATDLASTQAEQLRRLAGLLDAWNAELVPPAFPGPQGRKAAAKGAK